MHGTEGHIWPFLDGEDAVELVGEYFATGRHRSSPPAFSGAYFESFGGGGDAVGSRNRFSADDLVAVTFLGVKVPGWAALRILDTDAAELNALLRQIPVDLDLWETDPSLLEPDSATFRLWTAIEALPGVGWVTAGKLLARKRPRLVPVYDQVVKDALMPTRKGFWSALREELQDPAAVDRLREIHAQAELPDHVSVLRVLDVAVWMRNRGITQVAAEERTIRPLPFAAKP